MNTIYQILKDYYHPVKPYKSGHGDVDNVPMPELLVGIELEMENFTRGMEWSFGGIKFAEDGSLRNNGVECITQPIPFKSVPKFLEAFFKLFRVNEKNYSERCSTHVHVNVQDITFDQLCTIALLYQTSERLLFHFIGKDRQNNIFCVPWYQSGLTSNMVTGMQYNGVAATKSWQKYSALNLLPVTSQGTIEFRHLHGTNDVNLIVKWISLIAKMFEYAHKHTLEDAKHAIINMNTISNYREWLYNVFGQHADYLTDAENFEQALSKGVVDTKVMLNTPPKPERKTAKLVPAPHTNDLMFGDVADWSFLDTPLPTPADLRPDPEAATEAPAAGTGWPARPGADIRTDIFRAEILRAHARGGPR